MSKMTKGKLTLASRREEGGIQSRKKGRMSSIGTCFRGGLMSICTLSYFLKGPIICRFFTRQIKRDLPEKRNMNYEKNNVLRSEWGY